MTDKSFTNIVSMSDKAIAKHIGAFVRHHRLEQQKTQQMLAKAAGISRNVRPFPPILRKKTNGP